MEYITYIFKDESICTVPICLENIINCIKKAEIIVELPNNWDFDGSKEYSETTWKHAVLFLCDFAKQLYNQFNIIVDTPKIYPGDNGSIDIDWETPNYGLIINIAEGGELATYYGDNEYGNSIEGELSTKNFTIDFVKDLLI